MRTLDRQQRRLAIFALAAAGTVAIAAAPRPPSLSLEGQYAVATMFFAAVLWVTRAIPLPVTALSIPAVLTVFGVYEDLTTPLAGFADPIIFLAVSRAIAASYAFALPVSTPPNAIVFGSGYMEQNDMLRAGILLNVLMTVLLTAIISLLFLLRLAQRPVVSRPHRHPYWSDDRPPRTATPRDGLCQERNSVR